jgi:hypothetical protein
MKILLKKVFKLNRNILLIHAVDFEGGKELVNSESC